MKNNVSKRVVSAFLAFVMVFLMMPVLAITVNAAGDSVSINTDYSFSASIRYQTEYRINNRYTTIYNTFNEPEQKTKWQSFTEGVGKAKGIVGTTGNLAINLYTQITGWDSSKEWYENAGEMALNLACSYFGIQLPGPSESDKTIEAVGQMIDGVHDHLNDMENNIITELSDVVRDSDADLAAFIKTTATEAEWRTYLNAFYGIGSNFNYDAFRDNLNGAIDELNTAYDDYNIALESGNEELIQRRAELIKIKYDNLYYVLNYSISGGNYSPILEMRKRMTEGFSTEMSDEETFYSIPRILYAYKVVSASNDGMTDTEIAESDTEIAESCVGFALELYYTYLLAEQCLNACYGYQLSNILENNSVSYTAELPVGNSHITDSDIKRGLTTSVDIQKEVTDKVVADIAFLLNLENSYMYEIGGIGEIYEIPYVEQVSKGAFNAKKYPKQYGSFTPEEFCRINDEVSVGDIIYMNTMPEMFREMFKEGIFTFGIDQWNSKGEKTDASTVTNTGVVNILGNVGDTVIVTMYYNDVECYHMKFQIVERSFSGGMGIGACPYLISNKDQFEDITKSNAAFKLIDNIDFKGASIVPLGTLTGALDGNGFAVYGFTMSVETNAGLFDQVANGASVKNLTLGGVDNEKDYLVTISAGPNYSDELIAGGICAINYGVIENCTIMQTKVYSGRDVNQPTEYKIIGIVGGIAGKNYSIIRNCVVEKSLVQTDSKTQKDNHPAKCYAYSGGIAGINEGQIFDCSTLNNSIIGYTYSKDEDGVLNFPHDEGRGYTYCAGITANNKKTIENVYVFENYIEAKASCDSGTADSELFYTITSGTQNNCIEQKYNCIRKVSSIKVTENSYKESYYSGEYIDFSNLVVKDNNGEIINGYKVSGYDSNVVGTQTIIVSYITGYETIKDAFDITVLDIEAEELVVFSKPANTTQELNAVSLNTDGLMLLVKYNDGTSKILNNGEGAEGKEYTQRFDFSKIGKTTVTFNYEGLVATMDVEVVCTHKNTLIIDAIDATCTNAGYTKGVYCNNCNSYVSGHKEIPRLNEHPFGNWMEYSEQQHSRVCPCGDVEYAGHDWDDGVVTIEPTFTAAGELTKTCPDCGATKTEVIDPIDATEDAPYIIVDSKNAMIGQTVSVNISLKNNPGITSMRINVAYDSAVLRLTGVEYNSAMGGQSVLPENIESLDGMLILYWTDGFQDYEGDDAFATLTFEVYPDAVANTTTSISVTYDAEDIYNAEENNVLYACKDGIITFIDYIPGDINGDGIVNTKDTTRLMRYLAGWDVEVNEAALDVNGDDVVNTKDTTRLMRYLAGWDVEIH